QLLCYHREVVRRGCEIKNTISLGVVFLLNLIELCFELLVQTGVSEIAGNVEDSFGETLPGSLIQLIFGTKLRHRGLHRFAKFIVAVRLARSAEDCELAWNQTLLGQTKEGGQEFAASQ